ncbi:hypothetical protein PCE1_003277 [Barthelona sp. PCE]
MKFTSTYSVLKGDLATLVFQFWPPHHDTWDTASFEASVLNVPDTPKGCVLVRPDSRLRPCKLSIEFEGTIPCVRGVCIISTARRCTLNDVTTITGTNNGKRWQKLFLSSRDLVENNQLTVRFPLSNARGGIEVYSICLFCENENVGNKNIVSPTSLDSDFPVIKSQQFELQPSPISDISPIKSSRLPQPHSPFDSSTLPERLLMPTSEVRVVVEEQVTPKPVPKDDTIDLVKAFSSIMNTEIDETPPSFSAQLVFPAILSEPSIPSEVIQPSSKEDKIEVKEEEVEKNQIVDEIDEYMTPDRIDIVKEKEPSVSPLRYTELASTASSMASPTQDMIDRQANAIADVLASRLFLTQTNSTSHVEELVIECLRNNNVSETIVQAVKEIFASDKTGISPVRKHVPIIQTETIDTSPNHTTQAPVEAEEVDSFLGLSGLSMGSVGSRFSVDDFNVAQQRIEDDIEKRKSGFVTSPLASVATVVDNASDISLTEVVNLSDLSMGEDEVVEPELEAELIEADVMVKPVQAVEEPRSYVDEYRKSLAFELDSLLERQSQRINQPLDEVVDEEKIDKELQEQKRVSDSIMNDLEVKDVPVPDVSVEKEVKDVEPARFMSETREFGIQSVVFVEKMPVTPPPRIIAPRLRERMRRRKK